MGKRGPFECVVPGCHKRGTVSAITQHVLAVHEIDEAVRMRLKPMIENGDKITMQPNPYNKDPFSDEGGFKIPTWVLWAVGVVAALVAVYLGAELLGFNPPPPPPRP